MDCRKTKTIRKEGYENDSNNIGVQLLWFCGFSDFLFIDLFFDNSFSPDWL